jgi:hypothetical protein
MTEEDWERLRHMTVDQLVTATKLAGSSSSLSGTTTPEGYPFRIIVAVGSTEANMGAVSVLGYAENIIGRMAAWFMRADRP